MLSRYDFMSDGIVSDEFGRNYPDPLSLNYLNIKVSEKPRHVRLSEEDTVSFWLTASKVYGVSQLDDIVLTVNGVPHRNFLKNGDVILFPSESDIRKSFTKERGQ